MDGKLISIVESLIRLDDLFYLSKDLLVIVVRNNEFHQTLAVTIVTRLQGVN